MSVDFKMPVVGFKMPVPVVGFKNPFFFFLQSRRNFQLKPNFVFIVAPHFFML